MRRKLRHMIAVISSPFRFSPEYPRGKRETAYVRTLTIQPLSDFRSNDQWAEFWSISLSSCCFFGQELLHVSLHSAVY